MFAELGLDLTQQLIMVRGMLRGMIDEGQSGSSYKETAQRKKFGVVAFHGPHARQASCQWYHALGNNELNPIRACVRRFALHASIGGCHRCFNYSCHKFWIFVAIAQSRPWQDLQSALRVLVFEVCIASAVRPSASMLAQG